MEKVGRIDRLVVIGGSAGSLEVVLRMLSALPAGIRYPIVLNLHRKASSDTALTELLTSRTSLNIKEIEDKDRLTPGTVFIAPGDYHVLFERDGILSLDASEKVAFSRPSIDVAFQSAADAYGPLLTGVLLSGANADGSDGLKAIRASGGQAVVQLPSSARTPFMPQYAINHGAADQILDVPEMVALLKRL